MDNVVDASISETGKPEKTIVCKRLSANASKADRLLAHTVKMQVKSKLREYNYLRAQEHPERIFANQSQHHENYGETPQEQTKRMLAKNKS